MDNQQLIDALYLKVNHYLPDSQKALQYQYNLWNKNKPLKNLTVVDSTPVFFNTFLKYINLLAAGAKLSIAIGDLTPYDPLTVKYLKELNVPILDCQNTYSFDIVLDCSGCCKHFNSQYGYVELTRSGIHSYREKAKSSCVFAADSGRIKAIETTLGTGESFLRTFRQEISNDIAQKDFTVFGYGKVGRGVAYYLKNANCNVTIVDYPEVLKKVPSHYHKVSILDRTTLDNILSNQYCIIAVTGVKNALHEKFDLKKVINSNTYCALMGVENEYGPLMPNSRVLNNNRPFNFLLEEPTLLEYIETTFTLHNMGATELLNATQSSGMIIPSKELEDTLLAQSLQGIASKEIAHLLKDVETTC